ncbi:LytR/AlgR family response regulator transcription factor [Fusibacter ferrireducens]|uniref:Stage 0 sporulation protein A homolog n=1 Tax=Fusibacter ferrireducens TaxID=2785058 RepID=A0ABR9ZZK3_9FIRM|nr:LytTR family DNA-binding domain-containing protein [Fusibacter ferrireducens]MBF4695872.1 response regulator transcription factor [Fusibacter ferrireducens]
MKNIKKILIVEDDSIQRDLLIKWIDEMEDHFRVYAASSDQEALSIAREEAIDLFVMDIDLKSELNGFEVAIQLRANPKYQLTWILFLTVESSYELRAYREVHCHAFLDKPYPKAALQSMVKKLLGHVQRPEMITESKFLVAEAEQVLIRIRHAEIVFIEAKGRGSVVYTVRGNYKLPYKSLKNIEEDLADDKEFFKVHRSYLINIHYVKSIQRFGLKQYEITFYNCQWKCLLSKAKKEALEDIIGMRR